MNFPENVKYSTDHEWLRVEGSEAYVGISDFAQNELGEVVFVDITSVDEGLNQGDVFGSIEAVKTVSDLMMPVGGTVVEVNSKLEDAPELVNKDPYGDGWLVKVTLTDASEVDGLMSADEYKKFIGK